MASLLVHALFAAALQSLICLVMLGQGINEFVFYAAIASILVDSDHRSDGERSSVVHSLVAVVLVSILGISTTVAVADVWTKFLILSVVVGFSSHVLLDMADCNGIFVSPAMRKKVALFVRSERLSGCRSGRLHMIVAVISALTLLIPLL